MLGEGVGLETGTGGLEVGVWCRGCGFDGDGEGREFCHFAQELAARGGGVGVDGCGGVAGIGVGWGELVC